MSNINQFFPTSPFLIDPRLMPRWCLPGGDIIRSYSAATVASSVTGFFTGAVGSIDRIPGSVYITGAWSADTYRTVASISSGSGLVSAMFGPATSFAQTTTFRVTVDGIAYTFTAGTTADSERNIVGWGLPFTAYTAAGPYGFQYGAASPDGFTALPNTTSKFMVLEPGDPRLSAGNLLLFKRSLLVEVKISGTATGAGGTYVYAGVVMHQLS